MFRFRAVAVVHFAWLGVFAAAVVGCGSSGPKTVNVTGKVTVKGEPLTNCKIDFQPVDPACQAASGQIGADGTYTLYTGATGTPGAMVGKYKVVLRPDTSSDTSYMDSGTGPPATPDAGASKVPAEYMDVTTTPKEVEVTAGDNTINIEL